MPSYIDKKGATVTHYEPGELERLARERSEFRESYLTVDTWPKIITVNTLVPPPDLMFMNVLVSENLDNPTNPADYQLISYARMDRLSPELREKVRMALKGPSRRQRRRPKVDPL